MHRTQLSPDGDAPDTPDSGREQVQGRLPPRACAVSYTWEEVVGKVDFLPLTPRPPPPPAARRAARCGGNPNVMGRVAHTLPGAHQGARGAGPAVDVTAHSGRRQTTRPAVPPPHAPPPAAQLDQSRAPRRMERTDVTAGRPAHFRLPAAVGAVIGGPRSGGGRHFTRGGRRGEAAPRPLAGLGVRISPGASAASKVRLAHSSRASAA